MDQFILDSIPFAPEPEPLLASVRLKPGSTDAESFLALLDQVQRLAKPKALYIEASVDALSEDTVTIAGVDFHSRMLRLNLENAARVFPFVVTCGHEIDRLSLPAGDFLAQFWLDAIKESALHASFQALLAVLEARYALVKTASMSPGSGDVSVWPIEQQRLLFSLLGNVQEPVGVTLTDSCLMIPNKTISGIIFPTEKAIQTCQVCRQENCPSRQASFDQAAWELIQAA